MTNYKRNCSVAIETTGEISEILDTIEGYDELTAAALLGIGIRAYVEHEITKLERARLLCQDCTQKLNDYRSIARNFRIADGFGDDGGFVDEMFVPVSLPSRLAN